MLGGNSEDDPILDWVPILVGITTISGIAVWLLAGLTVTGRAATSPSGRFKSPCNRVLAGCVLFLLAIGLVVPPAGVYYQLMTPLPIPDPILPSPNGWDDLVAAGKMVENSNELNAINFYDTLPRAQLSTAVKRLTPAYERLRIGLEKPVGCPVDYDSPGINMDSIQAMRTLARALAGRGRLATMEGRFDEAADSFLECIRLGYALRRGGLIIDALVGIACSGIGCHDLYHIHQELSTLQRWSERHRRRRNGTG
jgi:hypothetical protein